MRVAAVIIFLSLRLLSCSCQYYHRDDPDSQFDIWIISGQSNAVGTNGWVRGRN